MVVPLPNADNNSNCFDSFVSAQGQYIDGRWLTWTGCPTSHFSTQRIGDGHIGVVSRDLN